MVHLLFLIKRKSGLSRQAFSQHWRDHHAPLARQIPGIRRYVQNHPLLVQSRQPTYDGVVELWMDDLDAAQAAFNSQEYRQGAYLDEPNFVDVKQVTRLQTRDHVLLDGAPINKDEALVKRISFIKRKPGMDREEFFRYWKDIHGPLALQLPGLQRYVQCHTLPTSYTQGEPAFDGVAQLWFETLADLQYAMSSPEYKERTRPDGEKFVDPSGLLSLVVEENRVIWPTPGA